jgi:D-alanyl-D-alanine carboxypeptidase/D-alanyl-D-alanine-endopeptidase (penicillin-binding protein 4)
MVLSLLLSLFLGSPVLRASPTDLSVLQARRTLDDLIRTSGLGDAQVGMMAVLLPGGEVIHERDAELRRIPASLVKLLTSAAALRALSPEYRFRTEFLVDSAGTLYIRGTGDPELFLGDICYLAEILQASGLSHLRDVVVDDSYFNGGSSRGIWSPSDSGELYFPTVSAVTLNWGAMEVWVRPGERLGDLARAKVIPDLGLFDVVTLAKTGRTKSDLEARLDFSERAKIEITGSCRLGDHARPVYVKVRDPGLYTGAALRSALIDRGIPAEGGVRREPLPGDSTSLELLHVHHSRRLLDILIDMNKFSSNFISEHLLMAMGAEVHGSPGTLEKGLAAVMDLMNEAGVRPGTYSLLDGSGLSRENHLSPSQFLKVLGFVFHDPRFGPEYLSSLALPGGGGTLKERFLDEEFQGRLRAKTGSMSGVSSLAGYVRTAENADVAFCLIVNGYEGTSDRMQRFQEKVVRALLAVRP